MRSRALFVLAAVAAPAACSADPTAPREELPRPSLVTESGCPGGFALTPAPPGTVNDENGDGQVCVLTFQAPPDGRTFYLERDNKT